MNCLGFKWFFCLTVFFHLFVSHLIGTFNNLVKWREEMFWLVLSDISVIPVTSLSAGARPYYTHTSHFIKTCVCFPCSCSSMKSCRCICGFRLYEMPKCLFHSVWWLHTFRAMVFKMLFFPPHRTFHCYFQFLNSNKVASNTLVSICVPFIHCTLSAR